MHRDQQRDALVDRRGVDLAVTVAAAAMLVVVLDLVLDLMLYRVHAVAHVASPSDFVGLGCTGSGA